VSARLARAALLVALSLAPLGARAETWDAAEVAEAEKLRAAEAARAAAYRTRVARGDVRGAAAPMPREAPQRPDASAGDALREAADIVDLLDRWFGRAEDEAAPPRQPTRDELRRRERERRRDRSAR
jgi:hypothetical protein